MNPERVCTASYRLLLNVLEEAYLDHKDGDLRQAFIYRHAQTILRLSEDVFHLEADQRCYSSAIVVRVMVESLFNLAAAVKDPRFAAEKVIWELDDEVNRMRKWIAGCEDTVAQLEAFSKSLRHNHGVTSVRKLNTLECATIADLEEQYRHDYFVFSQNVHATNAGILGAENGITRGQVIQSVVQILITSAVEMIQILPSRQPQRHMQKATNLLHELTTLVEKRAFQQLIPANVLESLEESS